MTSSWFFLFALCLCSLFILLKYKPFNDVLQCTIRGVHVTQITALLWKCQWWHFTPGCIIILFYILHCGLTLFSINRRLSITLFLVVLVKWCNKLNQYEGQTVFNSKPTILLVFNHDCSIDWSTVFIMACFREMTDHYCLHCADDHGGGVR